MQYVPSSGCRQITRQEETVINRRVPRARARSYIGGTSGEHGFSLIEVLVTLILSLLVFGVVLEVASVGQNTGRRDTARSLAVSEATMGLHQMTHELRQGIVPIQNCTNPCPTSAPSNTNVLDLIVCRNAGCLRVKYDCTLASPLNGSYKECCRYASSTLTASPASSPGTTSAPCGGGGRLVIDRLVGPSYVFQPPSGSTVPVYYAVTIDVPRKGEFSQGPPGTYELSGGIYLRNVGGDL